LNNVVGNIIHDKIDDIPDDLDFDTILTTLTQLDLQHIDIEINLKLMHKILPKYKTKLVNIFNKCISHAKMMRKLLQQSENPFEQVIGKHDIYYTDVDNYICNKISLLMFFTGEVDGHGDVDVDGNCNGDVVNYIGDIITNALDDYYVVATLDRITKNIQKILADFSDDKKISQKINYRYYSMIRRSIFACNMPENLLEKIIDRCIMEISDNTNQLSEIINAHDKYISILDEILRLENITIGIILSTINDDKIKFLINKARCANVPIQTNKIKLIKNKLINKKKFWSDASVINWNELSQELATKQIDSIPNASSNNKFCLSNIFNTSTYTRDSMLIITGHLLEIDEKFCKHDINAILIFSTGCVRIKRIVANSKNVVIISSIVIFEDYCEITLSGKKSNYVADGLPGKSSGNLSIFAMKIKNFKKTYVDVTGSAGSTGATGTNGIDGANGNIGCASSTKEVLSDIIPADKRNSKIERYQRIATFKGTKGTAGTNSTSGGCGGSGGYGGAVKIIQFDETRTTLIEYCGSKGADGANGSDGKPGVGGKDGDDYVEYRGHKYYTRHSENVSVNTRATDGIVKQRPRTPIPATPVTILSRDVIYAAYNKYLNNVNHSIIFKLLFSKQVIKPTVLLKNR
jgi:CRISPR/Cas system-associated endoribonuclease Cas2